jgi:GT2 family glycosyltransferase
MTSLHRERLAEGQPTGASRVAIRRAVVAALRSQPVVWHTVRRGRSAWRRCGGRVRRWIVALLSRHTLPAPSPRATRRHAEARSAADELDVDAIPEHLDRLATRPPATVIVPIHNAYDDLRRCLASLERNTSTRDTEVLLIDDASTDPRLAGLLDECGRLDGIRVLRNDTNLGYTRTINRAIEACSGDVVLLNSDCEVTPRWLENLVQCAYRDQKTATVTALSDNAGAFSVPRIGVANDRPDHLTADEVGRVVTRSSQRIAPTTPTGNGFCMYIKRAALAEVGPFDAEAFPRGYGEEGDFCMRCRNAGWVNVVDDATIVFHRRSASFGGEKDELLHVGRQRLDARHPEYTRLVRAFVKSDALTRVQATVRAAYDASARLAGRPRPRVLYVHHRGTGGTPATNADLMGALVDRYEPYLLTSDTKRLELSRVSADGVELIERWSLPERLRADQFSQPAYRATLADILTRHAVDLVHIRVLLAHTFDLPSVAHALGVPVVLSFHDYFLVCPTFHLLDEANRFCGGVCTPGDGDCPIRSDWVRGVPHLKHSWVKVWQQAVARMLDDCDAFVTTSPTARDIYLRAYPKLTKAPFHVIEHGRDLPIEPVDGPPGLSGRVRIVIPGSFDVHKGAPFIEQLRELDFAGRLEFHFLGKVPEEFRHLGIVHGPYERHEFTRKLQGIRPAFVAILSIWPETYSHTLSEAWAAGVPVLVTALGAPKERVESHGGGWILDHLDAAGSYKRIIEICDDPAEYGRVRAEAGRCGIRPVKAMADDYDHLYLSAFVSRRTVTRRNRDRPSRALRAGLFVLGGSAGGHPPTAYVRMLQRFRHPLVRRDVVAEPVDVRAFIDGGIGDVDLAVVQRTAVPPQLLDGFLDSVRRRGLPLVFEMDDDLLGVDGRKDTYDYHPHRASVERLLRAADLVTVSTERLRGVLSDRASRVVVVPNMLDEFLWFGDAAGAGERAHGSHTPDGVVSRLRAHVLTRGGRPSRPTCNLVYIGSRTHAEDLALLRPVMERLRQCPDLDVKLFVVGGEEPRSRLGRWYEPVPMPTTGSYCPYPVFVPWLRRQRHAWTIGLAPLRDTHFNRNKSDLKYLEYAALGLPGIFSDLVPYRESIRHEETGLLVENTTGAWYEEIRRLAHDCVLREGLAEAARRSVLGERCLRDDAGDYVSLLRSVTGSAVSVG